MKSMKRELLAAAAAAALIVGGTHVWAQSGGAGAGDTQLQGRSGAQSAPNATGTQQPGAAQVQGQGDVKAGKSGAQMQTQGGAKTSGGSQEQSQQSQESGKDGAKRPGQAQQPSGDMKKQQTTESKPGATDKPTQLSSEQRTKISSTIKSKDVNLKRVERTNINFNINVGTVVPRTIGLVPLPASIVAVVPAYRGYLYIVVGDELLIVHPSTYEIVAVIPA
jgi:hypothetical protein